MKNIKQLKGKSLCCFANIDKTPTEVVDIDSRSIMEYIVIRCANCGNVCRDIDDDMIEFAEKVEGDK